MSLDLRFIGLFLLAASWCDAGSPVGAYGPLPLVFERNQGQADPAVRFVARGRRYVAALLDDGVELQLKQANSSTIHVQFTGSRRDSRFDAPEKLPGVSNYLIGADPRFWIQGIPHYDKIWRRGMYPGIDVAFYGNQGQLEYDFVVQPGANPNKVRMHITGAARLRVDDKGDLILGANGEQLRLQRPIAFQEHDGRRRDVPAQYRLLANDVVGITMGDYDHTQPLVVDPVLSLVYSTYFGGSLADQANGIAVDALGNVWIAGSTASLDFPVTGSPKSVNAGGTDAFVAKLDPTGTTLLFATYLGGSGTDQSNGIAVDPVGNAYVAGSSNSPNFPTKLPFQGANAGGLDAFAVKLSSTGSLVYSTYLGGTADDSAAAIAVDANGIAYIAGYTSSGNFPTSSALQSQNHGGKDAFIVRLNAAGSALLYSTYFGGSADDQANGIAVDSSGNAYIAGGTSSSDFPVTAAFQPAYSGAGDAFAVKLNSSGVVVYSTYLGGSRADGANAIAVDSSGDAYVAGSTWSYDFPVKNAYQAGNADYDGINLAAIRADAFLAKLNPAGAAVFSTYFGGPYGSEFGDGCEGLTFGGNDIAYGVAVDAAGNAYLTGSTNSSGFPLQDFYPYPSGPIPTNFFCYQDSFLEIFLASFSPTGSLLYSTRFGGGNEVANAVAVDGAGAAYIAGYTYSTNFPLQTPLQSANSGGSDAFVSKFTFSTQGVRVFFGAPFFAPFTATVPITITGSGCSPGSYVAANDISGSGTPVIFQPGAVCTVSVQPTIVDPTLGEYVFAGWAAPSTRIITSTANPLVITAPAHGTTYDISFATAHQLLTTSVSPTGTGSITVSPPSSDGNYAYGTMVTITAVPAPGYSLLRWGGLSGNTNPQTVTMTQPYSVSAYFAPSAPPSVVIDTPQPLTVVSGSIAVTGWAIDNTTVPGTPINRVYVSANGVIIGSANYGVARPDVCNVYPGRTGCPNVGYSYALDSKLLQPGLNGITVSAQDTDLINPMDTGSATVIVSVPLAMTGTRAGVLHGPQFLEDSNGDGVQAPPDRVITAFAPPGGVQAGDIPVSGDWTGDGHSKVGFYRPSTGQWFLDANNSGAYDAGDSTYNFGGVPGDIPVVGDWNGVQGLSTHKDCIGLFREGFFWILDLNCNGSFDGVGPDAAYPFGGLNGDVPVVGKWTGGTTRVGVVRRYVPVGSTMPQGNPFFWLLDSVDANAGPSANVHQPIASECFAFGGLAGDVFLTGDWYGTGKSSAAVYRNGLWVLDAAFSGDPQASHGVKWTFFYGAAGDVPVAGKW